MLEVHSYSTAGYVLSAIFFLTGFFCNSSFRQCNLNPPTPNPYKNKIYHKLQQNTYIFLQIYPEFLSNFNNNYIGSE